MWLKNVDLASLYELSMFVVFFFWLVRLAFFCLLFMFIFKFLKKHND